MNLRPTELVAPAPGHDVEAARVATRKLFDVRREIAASTGGLASLAEILAWRDEGRRL